MANIIQVTGRGVVYGTPDCCTLSIETLSIAKTAMEANKTQSSVFRYVQNTIVNNGVEASDIISSSFCFGEQYKKDKSGYPSDEREGFYARNSATIRIRDVKNVAKILDIVVSSGASKITGPTLTIDNPRMLEDGARKKACADARLKADLYCGENGLRVAGIESLHESLPRQNTGGKFALMDEEDTVLIGQVPVEINIDVKFIVESVM